MGGVGRVGMRLPRGVRRKRLAKHRAERRKYPIAWRIAGVKNRYYLHTKPIICQLLRGLQSLIVAFVRK